MNAHSDTIFSSVSTGLVPFLVQHQNEKKSSGLSPPAGDTVLLGRQKPHPMRMVEQWNEGPSTISTFGYFLHKEYCERILSLETLAPIVKVFERQPLRCALLKTESE
jgi:hypothetical protein